MVFIKALYHCRWNRKHTDNNWLKTTAFKKIYFKFS